MWAGRDYKPDYNMSQRENMSKRENVCQERLWSRERTRVRKRTSARGGGYGPRENELAREYESERCEGQELKS
jgi:hypothetical protein